MNLTNLTRCFPFVLVLALTLLSSAGFAETGLGRHKQLFAVPVPGKVVIDGKLDDWDLGAAAVHRLLQRTGDFTALVCYNGAIAALRESGREVPGDVSVTGFDNAAAAADFPGQLATVSFDRVAIDPTSVLTAP